jgi:hypothetical protein
MTAARLSRSEPVKVLGLPGRSIVAAAGALVAAGLFAGCGREIGDACIISTDCGTDVNLICDLASLDGYCTIPGCSYGTCPDESVCIRFFVASFENLPCDPATEDLGGEVSTNDCGLDEVCSLNGQCVPVSSEVRFCMKSCGSADDCRDGYECRDEALMRAHGGEPVPPPGERLSEFEPFCAQAPVGGL